MSESLHRQRSHLLPRYSQQWRDIITRQWAEVWQTTTSRTSQNRADFRS